MSTPLVATAFASGHRLEHTLVNGTGNFVNDYRENARGRVPTIKRSSENHARTDRQLPLPERADEILIESGLKSGIDGIGIIREGHVITLGSRGTVLFAREQPQPVLVAPGVPSGGGLLAAPPQSQRSQWRQRSGGTACSASSVPSGSSAGVVASAGRRERCAAV